MSDASSTDAVSGVSPVEGDGAAATTPADGAPAAPEPQLRVLRGNPSDAEIAALVAVLGAAGGGVAETGTPERNMWGHPVDKLRFPLFSWQRITMLERTHMRR